jgi:cation transport ATPase
MMEGTRRDWAMFGRDRAVSNYLTMIAAATAAAQMPQDTEKAELDRSESSPLSPGAAMSFSSLSAVSNALRLRST